MRTGLAAEVPTLELCREMDAVPALRKAFEDSRTCPLAWNGVKGLHCCDMCGSDCLPAPTVREMLAWLTQVSVKLAWPHDTDFAVITVSGRHDMTNPDDMARACIEAAKAGA